MALNILGGIAKGRSLSVPKGDQIRPTSVRLKRRFFDAFQDWQGLYFFDLCAGTGSIGLEAWSRGADSVTLVESGKRVIPLLKKNVEQLEKQFPHETEERKIHIEDAPVLAWLKRWKEKYLSFDQELRQSCVLFFDPPYREHQLYQKVCHFLLEGWFEGILVIESDTEKGILPQVLEQYGLPQHKLFTQGATYLWISTFSG